MFYLEALDVAFPISSNNVIIVQWKQLIPWIKFHGQKCLLLYCVSYLKQETLSW